MRTPKIGKRLQAALDKYAEFITSYEVEADYYGTECGDDNIYSIWIYMVLDHLDSTNERTIVHEHNQTSAVQELKELVELIKSRRES